MAWKETNVEKLAKSLGLDPVEVREKQKLMELIAEARQERGLSQVALAKKLGVSQGRIAQIESGGRYRMQAVRNSSTLPRHSPNSPDFESQLATESLTPVFGVFL